MLKSTSPVNQTLFSQHQKLQHITLLPSADIGDCSNGVTVTLNGKTDYPLLTSRVAKINPVASDPGKWLWVNLTIMSPRSLQQWSQ